MDDAHVKNISETKMNMMRQWLLDGQTWIAVFENKDMNNGDFGRRVAFPFDNAVKGRAKLGETKAPDAPGIGLGWRYILIAICDTAEEAAKHVFDS